MWLCCHSGNFPFLLSNSLRQQLIRKGRQIVITGSNLNLLKYFWQRHKRVCGSLTVHLIWLKIPSSAQSWHCELLTSQSLSYFTVKVQRERGQNLPGVPWREHVDAFADVWLNPYTFSTWSMNTEREIDLNRVKHSVSVSSVCHCSYESHERSSILLSRTKYNNNTYLIACFIVPGISEGCCFALRCAGGLRGFLSVIVKAHRLYNSRCP